MGNTEHALEEVEHAKHHASAPWERNVAVSMAIVAAVLAWVTMMSHRGHNDVLRYQSESNRHQTEANVFHTRASDQWAFFQAKNSRSHTYKTMGQLLDALPIPPETKEAHEKLKGEWAKQVERYEAEMPDMKKEAEHLVREGEEMAHKSQEALEESEHAHHKADRFDLAELMVELSLVLCSLTVLTHKQSFWLLGLFIGCAGFVTALLAYLAH